MCSLAGADTRISHCQPARPHPSQPGQVNRPKRCRLSGGLRYLCSCVHPGFHYRVILGEL